MKHFKPLLPIFIIACIFSTYQIMNLDSSSNEKIDVCFSKIVHQQTSDVIDSPRLIFVNNKECNQSNKFSPQRKLILQLQQQNNNQVITRIKFEENLPNFILSRPEKIKG